MRNYYRIRLVKELVKDVGQLPELAATNRSSVTRAHTADSNATDAAVARIDDEASQEATAIDDADAESLANGTDYGGAMHSGFSDDASASESDINMYAIQQDGAAGADATIDAGNEMETVAHHTLDEGEHGDILMQSSSPAACGWGEPEEFTSFSSPFSSSPVVAPNTGTTGTQSSCASLIETLFDSELPTSLSGWADFDLRDKDEFQYFGCPLNRPQRTAWGMLDPVTGKHTFDDDPPLGSTEPRVSW
jgi:hypothetical protein